MKLSKLTIPFQRQETGQWRKREDILFSLRQIHDNADEAHLCLEKPERTEKDLTQAMIALSDLEQAINKLNRCLANVTSRKG